MVRLILVRHGNTFEDGQIATMVGARTDLPLTKEGREQARRVALALIREKISPKAIYAGTLLRQTQTAAIVREALFFEGAVQSGNAALTEIDYGPWEGLAQEEIMRKWPEEHAGWASGARWPREIFGRSPEEHLRDIQTWLARLRASYAEDDAVFAVTSNGILRFFYSLGKKALAGGAAKVKTGHFCELSLAQDTIEIQRWNVLP